MPSITGFRYQTRIYIHGLINAIIGGASNSVVVAIVDPQKFNLSEGAGNLGMVALVSALVSGALYLREHPLPDPEKDTDAMKVANQQIADIKTSTGTGG